jgi:putative membrane protein
MLRTRLIGAAVIGLACATLPQGANAAMNVQDSTFVKKAGQAGTAEVKLAALALRKSANPHVIAFAKEMRTDHGKANTQLMTIAQSRGLAPAGIAAKDAALMSELKAQSGADFDRHYLKSQLPAHHEALALFQAEAARGSDRALVAFAKQTIPVIESHIVMDQHDIASLGSGAMSMRIPGQK